MNSTAQPIPKSIILLGASFATGNLGVSALAWSCIKIIKAKWPDATIVLVGGGRQPGIATIQGDGQKEFFIWPVRYCLNLLAPHHIVELGLITFFCRYLPFLKHLLVKNRSTVGELLRCEMICDITGGDSFSDMYGLPRLIRSYLLKRVCQMTGKPFVLLPQTYGPFKSFWGRYLARRVLTCATVIYSRDREGVEVVKELTGASHKIRLCPDVAFVMDAIRPSTIQTVYLEQLKGEGKRLIGLNISGLLYHGGYTRNNMFGLTCDYPSLITDIIINFVKRADQYVLLVPHVLPAADFVVEDDLVAIREALKALPADTQKRVIVLEKGYDQNETKYIIGLCDFFLGSRMHATIAALSQGIPAVGLAYSRKFVGVFETAGVADCVLDLRLLNNQQLQIGIQKIFSRNGELRFMLQKKLPEIQGEIFNMFKRWPE